MKNRVVLSQLNASTIDILNVIRKNASQAYQDDIPEVADEKDIPRVGEVLMGYPARANEFVDALINRIAAVLVKSSLFRNPYKNLLKGEIRFGETIEEVFVNIAKVRTFSYEKAAAREFKRTMPDVRSVFHIMNWNVQYPVTVTETDLQKAFLSMDGVQDLIAKIVDSVYKAEEYDEYLLFKYLIIKGITSGKVYPVKAGDLTNMDNGAVTFRAFSNKLTFMSESYNAAGVKTVTPKDKQVIFMDSRFNAQFDVEVLSRAFNMDKADFMGRLYLIDSWNTFDNERFADIRAESDMIEEVTSAELALMDDVVAFLADEDWFMVYNNVQKFTTTFVAAGDYWNYFYRVQKTISYSPFSNALAFVTDTAAIDMPETITATVESKNIGSDTVILTVVPDEVKTLASYNGHFVQTEDAVKAGVAVHRYGAYIFPAAASITPVYSLNGTLYTASAPITTTTDVGTKITLSK